MPWITFIRNITDPDHGVIYQAGYCADVAPRIGAEHVAAGNAVWGKADIQKPEPIKVRRRLTDILRNTNVVEKDILTAASSGMAGED